MAEFEGRGGEGTYTTRTRAPDTVSDAVTGLSQGMNALVRGHLALARMEMTRDLKSLGKDAAIEFAGIPMLAASYLLLWIGLGYLLALAVPVWAAFFICAGANLLFGLALMAWGYARLKKQKLDMPATVDEVRRDRDLASQLREPTPQLRAELQAPAATPVRGQLH